MSIALVIVDIQNDYFPGGAMENVGATQAAAQARLLLDAFRRKSLPVIHIQHLSTRPGATFFLPGTAGAEIHESVRPLNGESMSHNHLPSAFRETPLLEHLRKEKITGLAIAGMMTHMCIDTTTRAAADLGFSCQLAQDACATRALAFNGVQVPAQSVQAAYLAGLNGPFAKVMPAGEIAAGL